MPGYPLSAPTTQTATFDPSLPARFAEADFLKVIGIVAVVLIHSTRARWDPEHSFGEIWLKQILRFAVPGFLVASGFLYSSVKRISHGRSLRRLRRVFLPYLLASICAEVFYALGGAPRDFATIGTNFALANSFGPYYYVFVLVPLVLISPVLSRMPRRILWILFLAGVVLQGLFETQLIGSPHAIWSVRNPIVWWPYFLLGWLARLHYPRLRAHLTSHRLTTVIVLGACLLACWLARGMGARPEFILLTTWLGIYFAIATVFAISSGRRVSSPVRWLSEATYAIYLFHLFFVIPGVDNFRAAAGVFEPFTILLIWCLGLVGSVAIVLAARAVLGERSRDVVGA